MRFGLADTLIDDPALGSPPSTTEGQGLHVDLLEAERKLKKRSRLQLLLAFACGLVVATAGIFGIMVLTHHDSDAPVPDGAGKIIEGDSKDGGAGKAIATISTASPTADQTRSPTRKLIIPPAPTLSPVASLADSTIAIYLGNGCFWERQYAYANLEISIGHRPCEEAIGSSQCLWPDDSFGRSWLEVTSRVGYAGGKRIPSNGHVCYHHTSPSDDLYSDYGHAEVVQVVLDVDRAQDQFRLLARDFFHSFSQTSHGVQRPDPGDQGLAYRSLVGIPGGMDGPLYPILVEENVYNMQLIRGVGDDTDGRGDVYDKVYIMDLGQFPPFFPGEQYHQFHSNFFGDPYPNSYVWTLWQDQIDAGLIDPTGCPENEAMGHWRRLGMNRRVEQ